MKTARANVCLRLASVTLGGARLGLGNGVTHNHGGDVRCDPGGIGESDCDLVDDRTIAFQCLGCGHVVPKAYEGQNRNGGTDRYVLVDDVFRALPKRAASRGRPLTYLEPVRWLARSRSLCSSHARSLSLRRRCCVSRSNSARVLVSTSV